MTRLDLVVEITLSALVLVGLWVLGLAWLVVATAAWGAGS